MAPASLKDLLRVTLRTESLCEGADMCVGASSLLSPWRLWGGTGLGMGADAAFTWFSACFRAPFEYF